MFFHEDVFHESLFLVNKEQKGTTSFQGTDFKLFFSDIFVPNKEKRIFRRVRFFKF